jgi:ribosomal subunit interface protein
MTAHDISARGRTPAQPRPNAALSDGALQVQVSGRQVDVGEALRSRIIDELTGQIGKFFERGGSAEVVVSREAHLFKVDCSVLLASGQQVLAHGTGGDAHAAFSSALERIEKRVRRYKRRLKNHHAASPRLPDEMASVTVFRAPEDVDDESFGEAGQADDGPPGAMVIAETERVIQTLTVGMAVLELDLSNYPVILFRNAAHGGLSVVYRRPDGNIGWIDPERTRNPNGAAS